MDDQSKFQQRKKGQWEIKIKENTKLIAGNASSLKKKKNPTTLLFFLFVYHNGTKETLCTMTVPSRHSYLLDPVVTVPQ